MEKPSHALMGMADKKYPEAVHKWSLYNNLLLDTSLNMYLKNVRGIILNP